MEHVTSRKNKTAAHLRALGTDRAYRRETGLFLCDGGKLLREALSAGAEIDCVLWPESPAFELGDCEVRELTAPKELVEYVSPLKNTSGPVFAVKMRKQAVKVPVKSAVVLENLQDPGNVGSILRTAGALGIGTVLLVGDCADIYNPKTVRSTMGAVFRVPVLTRDYDGLKSFLEENKLRLYGAALTEPARDIRTVDTEESAVAIGTEGQGLSERLLSMCDGQVIIPMEGNCQSLNAAAAAAILMWEIRKSGGDGACRR